MANTVRVKLRDSNSSFYDQEQRAGLFGKQVAELKKTERVMKALKGKHIIETEDEIYPKPEVVEAAKEEVKEEAPKVDYTKKTKAEISALLTEKGIEHSESATKLELIALLEA